MLRRHRFTLPSLYTLGPMRRRRLVPHRRVLRLRLCCRPKECKHFRFLVSLPSMRSRAAFPPRRRGPYKGGGCVKNIWPRALQR